MRAIVLRGVGSINVEEVKEPYPQKGELKAVVKAVGICGTDFEIYQGKHISVNRLFNEGRLKYLIPGHEWSGVIVDIKGEFKGFDIGDRITSETSLACGLCYYCSISKPNLCTNTEEVGITRDGAMAENVNLPIKIVHKVPEDISFNEAAMIEPLSVSLHAVNIASRSMDLSDNRIAIFGDGTIGLLISQVVLKEEPREVFLFGKSDDKLKLAEKFGDIICINTGSEANVDIMSRIKDVLGPIGADIVIEAAPGCQVVKEVLWAVRKGGIVVLVGLHDECKFNVDDIVFKELTVKGSLSSPGVWNRAIELISTGQVDVKSLISCELELRDGVDFIRSGGEPGIIKAIIHPR